MAALGAMIRPRLNQTLLRAYAEVWQALLKTGGTAELERVVAALAHADIVGREAHLRLELVVAGNSRSVHRRCRQHVIRDFAENRGIVLVSLTGGNDFESWVRKNSCDVPLGPSLVLVEVVCLSNLIRLSIVGSDHERFPARRQRAKIFLRILEARCHGGL
jgi:hypothetical protein